MIYLDSAATSLLKPSAVERAVVYAMRTMASPGRGGHSAALKAAEIGADVLLMAKNIDGVYTADPKTDPTAVRLDSMTYDRILEEHLNVIDSTAACLLRDNAIPTMIFALDPPENIARVVCGERIGTIVR